ncbi:FxSxx-COOH system tetratricopeptide repeat protein [Streptomyces microflavus]
MLDNVDTPRNLGPGSELPGSYRGWVRPEGAGLLLVTTRDSARDTWGPKAQLVPLEPLSADAAGAVLRDAAPDAGTPEEAAALGGRLGGLPLALDTAGRYLANPTSRYRTFTAYQRSLDTEFDDLIGAEHPQGADPEVARRVVRHTFGFSLTQLHTDGYTLARPTLFLLALLAPAPVPRTFLTPALLTDATGQSATAAELDAALAALHQYNLINTPTAPTTDTSDGQALPVGQVVLHPLVHEVIGLTSPPGTDRTTCHTALDTHLTRTVHDTTSAGRAGWPTAHLLAPHLPALLHRTPPTDFTTSRNVLDSLADTLQNAGAAAGENLLRQCVLDAETHHLGPDHPRTLASRSNLGTALRTLGRYREAADLHQRTLTDCERFLGPAHPGTLASRNNLAHALNDLGHHQEAADLHQRTLTDYERVLGPDHLNTLASRNNLAGALRALGRHEEATDLHQRTLTDYERVLEPDHPYILTSRSNVARALRALGRHEEAVALNQRTLTDYERVLGPDHPSTLTSRNNLARALSELGRHEEAADLHQRNLTDYERVLRPDHPDTLTSRNNLARALSELGRHEEAADLHQRNLTDRERILGPDHPDTLTSRNNLARALNAAARSQRWRRPWRRTRSSPAR